MALKIVKREGKSPCWWIRGTVKGQPVFESTRIAIAGKRPGAEVEEYRDRRERELNGPGKKTFADAAEYYLLAGGSPRFLDPIVKKLGQYRMGAIDQPLIDQLAKEIYPNCNPASLNRQFYTPFIAVWNYASTGQNAMCQTVRWRRPKAGQLQQVRKPVSYEDAVTFINACPIQAARIMFFLFWTGCRPLEAITIQCENINIKDRWAVLTDTKTGEPRGIPLHRSLIPMLEEEIKKGGVLFRNRHGKPYSISKVYSPTGRILNSGGGQIATAVKVARGATGMNITPYVGRHTVATFLDDKVPSKRKDAILGHSRDIRAHYVHLPRQDLIDAIDKLPDAAELGLRSDLFPCKIRAVNGSESKK